MGVLSDAAVSRGDLMQEIAELKRRLQSVETARRLESAKIGRGGLRIQGGRLLAEDASGERVFEVTTIPPEIFMRPELIQNVVEAILTSPAGRALAAGIFADRVDTDTIPQAEGTASGSFTDLATVGPQVTLHVSAARKAIVWLSSRMDAIAADNLVDTKDMSVAVSGASSIGPTFANALTVEHANNDTDHSSRVRTRASAQVTLTAADGLNEGENTFTAKYRTGETSFSFADRTITVMAL